MSAALGISLGKTNYCLKALLDRGWVKVVNFRRSRNKVAYFYRLTPKGISEKGRAARRFLHCKLEEHERIAVEIEVLRVELLAARCVSEKEALS